LSNLIVHLSFLLTSTQYASELKICELAQGYNKLVKKLDGHEYMISPFAPINLPVLDKNDIDIDNNYKDDDDEELVKSKDEQPEIQIIEKRRKGSHHYSH